MIPGFSLYELFPTFICANNTGNMIKSFSEFEMFNLFHFFTFSSSPSSADMVAISGDYFFRHLLALYQLILFFKLFFSLFFV